MSVEDIASFIKSPLVDLYVGGERRHWLVHHDLLCFHSSFFETALKGHFEESASRKVEFPDDDPAVFELFIQWLYSGSIGRAIKPSTDKAYAFELAQSCFALWILCDKLGTPRAKNAAVDTFRRSLFYSEKVLSQSTFLKFCTEAAPQSPFRRLLGHWVAWLIHNKKNAATAKDRDMHIDSITEGDSVDGVFVAHLIKALRDNISQYSYSSPLEKIGCFYHQHVEGEVCDDQSRPTQPNTALATTQSASKVKKLKTGQGK
ncbi:MAG: hypothetical protein M1817_001032 [Caeruleum heppii]|nr:MAG: hypothetical protein M1817_001032 [Caeruleum heppii]